MSTGLSCPIGLFPRQEGEVARLTKELNQASTAAEKGPWAQTLIAAVELLLGCERYDEGRADCRLCRHFSELRRNTATLIIRAGRLDSQRQP